MGIYTVTSAPSPPPYSAEQRHAFMRLMTRDLDLLERFVQMLIDQGQQPESEAFGHHFCLFDGDLLVRHIGPATK